MQGLKSGVSLSRLRHAWLLGIYIYWVNRGRERERESNLRVIAALTHVDMIIGVDGSLGTQLSAKQFDSTIGNDLLRYLGRRFGVNASV